MMRRRLFLFGFFSLLIVGACARTAEQESGTPDVAALLSNPRYEVEVSVFGLVGDLGTMFCPCFTLTSGGETLTVWYDSMVMADGSQLPAVSVEEVQNGEVVTVTGWLQAEGGGARGASLYATQIVRGTSGEGCDTAVEATPCVEE